LDLRIDEVINEVFF